MLALQQVVEPAEQGVDVERDHPLDDRLTWAEGAVEARTRCWRSESFDRKRHPHGVGVDAGLPSGVEQHRLAHPARRTRHGGMRGAHVAGASEHPVDGVTIELHGGTG